MTLKKDRLVVVGDIILAVALVALVALEIMNPQGGAAMIESLLG